MPAIIAAALTDPAVPRVSATFNYQARADRNISLSWICPTWLTEPTSTHVRALVERSFDGGATWEQMMDFESNCGDVNRFGNMPTAGFQVVDATGPCIGRCTLTVSAPVVIGVNATIV